jgi:hypothetical protein
MMARQEKADKNVRAIGGKRKLLDGAGVVIDRHELKGGFGCRIRGRRRWCYR